MKKSLFIPFIIVSGLILFPAFCLGATTTYVSNVDIYCDYRIGGDMDCSGTIVNLIDLSEIATSTYTIPLSSVFATSSATGSAGLIDQSWTYGELFIAFMILFFILYTFLKDILRFFFPDKIRILRNNQAL